MSSRIRRLAPSFAGDPLIPIEVIIRMMDCARDAAGMVLFPDVSLTRGLV